MGESLISRRGGGGGPSVKTVLKTEIITANTIWNVPQAKNQEFSVRIFGGGGGGSAYAGGGGGWMNNAILKLNIYQLVNINIGTGGINPNNSGGTTFFGNYLSANGGGGAYDGNGGSGGSGGGSSFGNGGTGYQFGGGGSDYNGGNSELWGGGGGAGSAGEYAGYGGPYGGGGGAGGRTCIKNNVAVCKPGNGGYYGGGGGGCSSNNRYGIRYGIGGLFNNNGTWMPSGLTGNGGSGASESFNSTLAEDGTNTSTWTNVFHDGNEYFRGWGKAGGPYSTYTLNAPAFAPGGGGGGGYGGNGGTVDSNKHYMTLDDSTTSAYFVGGGGGGGYGGNGGNCYFTTNIVYSREVGGGGGGGGGYGGDGGDGTQHGGGGGGGYGKSARGGNNRGGGGGYYGRGGDNAGGGGSYGNGGYAIPNNSSFYASETIVEPGYGAGGHSANGGGGICIIQYYAYEIEE